MGAVAVEHRQTQADDLVHFGAGFTGAECNAGLYYIHTQFIDPIAEQGFRLGIGFGGAKRHAHTGTGLVFVKVAIGGNARNYPVALVDQLHGFQRGVKTQIHTARGAGVTVGAVNIQVSLGAFGQTRVAIGWRRKLRIAAGIANGAAKQVDAVEHCQLVSGHALVIEVAVELTGA